MARAPGGNDPNAHQRNGKSNTEAGYHQGFKGLMLQIEANHHDATEAGHGSRPPVSPNMASGAGVRQQQRGSQKMGVPCRGIDYFQGPLSKSQRDESIEVGFNSLKT